MNLPDQCCGIGYACVCGCECDGYSLQDVARFVEAHEVESRREAECIVVMIPVTRPNGVWDIEESRVRTMREARDVLGY